MPVAQSSHIQHYNYDPDIATLAITFTNGAKYVWNRVPISVYNDFHSSGSKGAFLHSKIRGNYPETKVNDGRSQRKR